MSGRGFSRLVAAGAGTALCLSLAGSGPSPEQPRGPEHLPAVLNLGTQARQVGQFATELATVVIAADSRYGLGLPLVSQPNATEKVNLTVRTSPISSYVISVTVGVEPLQGHSKEKYYHADPNKVDQVNVTGSLDTGHTHYEETFEAQRIPEGELYGQWQWWADVSSANVNRTSGTDSQTGDVTGKTPPLTFEDFLRQLNQTTDSAICGRPPVVYRYAAAGPIPRRSFKGCLAQLPQRDANIV